MALNKTGTPDTNDIVLGRGKLYIAANDSSTDLPTTGFRDCGNCPAFTVTVTTESLKHQSSMTGYKTTDIDVVISREISAVAFDLEEQSDQNLALWMLGTTSSAQTNGTVAGFTEYAMITSVTKGLWYPIVNSTGVRCYNITTGNLTVEKSGSPDTPLVEGTDYVLNTEMGLIFFKTTSSTLSNSDQVDVTLAAAAGAGTVDKVFALMDSARTYCVLFIEENPNDGSALKEYRFHKVQVAPSGDLAKISDDWGKMSFSGSAQKSNATSLSASPYVTITDLSDA